MRAELKTILNIKIMQKIYVLIAAMVCAASMSFAQLLDLIGDISLTGRKLPALDIRCECGGHKHNVIFAKILLANSEDK